MQPFTVLTGVAAPLKIVNVDTDMIIPKQYLKTIKRTGLGTGELLLRDPATGAFVHAVPGLPPAGDADAVLLTRR